MTRCPALKSPKARGTSAAPTIDKATITAALHDGDPAAYATLVETLSPRLARFATQMFRTMPQIDVHDAVQDALTRILEVGRNYDPCKGGAAYLMTVGCNVMRDIWRSERRRRKKAASRPMDASDGSEPADSRLMAPDAGVTNADLVKHLLSLLSDKLREALVEYETEGLTLTELGRRHEIPWGTAATRVWKARLICRRELERLGLINTASA